MLNHHLWLPSTAGRPSILFAIPAWSNKHGLLGLTTFLYGDDLQKCCLAATCHSPCGVCFRFVQINLGTHNDHMLAGDTMSHLLAAADARRQAISNSLLQRKQLLDPQLFESNIELREEAGSLLLHELEMALLNGHIPILPEESPGDACTPSELESRREDNVLQKPEVERSSHTKEGRMLVGLELGWKWPLLPLEIDAVTPGWVTRCLEHPQDSHQILRVCFNSHVPLCVSIQRSNRRMSHLMQNTR
jgi:hypothetical protein